MAGQAALLAVEWTTTVSVVPTVIAAVGVLVAAVGVWFSRRAYKAAHFPKVTVSRVGHRSGNPVLKTPDTEDLHVESHSSAAVSVLGFGYATALGDRCIGDEVLAPSSKDRLPARLEGRAPLDFTVNMEVFGQRYVESRRHAITVRPMRQRLLDLRRTTQVLIFLVSTPPRPCFRVKKKVLYSFQAPAAS